MRAPRPLQGPGVLRRRYVRSPAPMQAETSETGGQGKDGSRPPSTEGTARQSRWTSGRLLTGFVCLQIACQLALLVEAISAVRVVVRILAFGVSLALIFLVPGRSLRHPAMPLLIASMTITALNMFHPQASGVLAGLAQLGIQIAILAPLFWVTRLRMDAATFRVRVCG